MQTKVSLLRVTHLLGKPRFGDAGRQEGGRAHFSGVCSRCGFRLCKHLAACPEIPGHGGVGARSRAPPRAPSLVTRGCWVLLLAPCCPAAGTPCQMLCHLHCSGPAFRSKEAVGQIAKTLTLSPPYDLGQPLLSVSFLSRHPKTRCPARPVTQL